MSLYGLRRVWSSVSHPQVSFPSPETFILLLTFLSAPL